MSWISNYKYSWYESFALKIICAGGYIPRHIAFVMDGNRRFAKSEHLERIEGHARGFTRLADCLRWCLDVGIREVTAFAFSIENFKRTDEEVNGLLNLARDKFSEVSTELPKLKAHGVQIRVIGNISLLPQDLREQIACSVLETEMNDKLFLNIAFSYTSRDEISQAVETILVQGKDLESADISECLLEECLYTRHSPPPDLLFRTSGETRISDFLMWQLTTTVIYFTNILWPKFTIWHFLAGILSYQRAHIESNHYNRSIQIQREHISKNSNFYSHRVQTFLQKLDIFRRNMLIRIKSTKCNIY